MNQKKSKFFALFSIILAAFFARIVLSPLGTLTLDQNTFIAWGNSLSSGGFLKFYSGWSDYLPGYLYVLWFLSKISSLIPWVSPVLLYKLPAIIADLGTGILIYLSVSKIKNKKLGLIASFLYVFNPAVLSNSTFWGQVDSVPVFFVLASLYFLDSRILFSAFFLALATITKPQAVLLVPMIFLYLLHKKTKSVKILLYGFVGALVFLGLFYPFYNSSNGSFLNFVLDRVNATTTQYPYGSVNAFSFWGLFGFWKNDNLFSQILGVVVPVVVSLLVYIKKRKLPEAKFIYSSLVFLSGFLFVTRMHERHLLPALAPILIASFSFPSALISYLIISITYIANMHYSYIWITQNFKEVFSLFQVQLFIFLNIISLIFIYFSFWREDRREIFNKEKLIKYFKGFLKNFDKRDEFSKIKISPKVYNFLFILILVFAFVTRVYRLYSPTSDYFDEIYHAFTAREILHGNPKAWEWWNEPPKGYAYEWTHPPLSKLIMVGGMMVLGENPVGWRMPAAISGTLTVVLVYAISQFLFKDRLLSTLAAAVFSLDGLSLVLSRIGMNDSYFLLFALVSIYLYMRDRNFLSAIFLGLAAASKWSTMWTLPIYIVAHFALKKKIRLSYLWFLILPPLVYIATYIPMFTSGHGFDIFIGMQKQMWWYHTNLRATHPFTSPWYTWPFLYKPVWLYTGTPINGVVENVYLMGNPIVFWFGVFSVLYCLYRVIKHKFLVLGLVVFAYFVYFAPWALSPRIMFLYHYLPSIPFMIICIAYFLRKNMKFILPFFVIAGVVFVYFYPRFIGYPVSLWLNDSYYWLNSWH